MSLGEHELVRNRKSSHMGTITAITKPLPEQRTVKQESHFL